MAQLTRDQLVTELTNRGWSKFATADLQRYMDWALQRVTSESRWTPQLTVTTGIAITTSGVVALTGVDAIGNIREIQRVYLTTALYQRKLTPMDEDQFYGSWYPEILRGAGVGQSAASPEFYFIHNNNLYFLPLPQSAFTCEVHYLKMPQTFATGGSTSGLPERFDKILLVQAEAICHRRAQEFEKYQAAEVEMLRMIETEQSLESQLWREEPRRIEPYS